MIAVIILTHQGGTIFANQQASNEPEVLEEIRENIMEVRLALQKGDLIEALQHLNNVDEDLLLLESGTQSSKSVPAYGNFSNKETFSYDAGNTENLNDAALALTGSEISNRKLNITFVSIFVNNNHDILSPAEWQLDAYANDKRINLSDNPGMGRVESGQVISFNGKSTVVDVPENSTLRIVTVGIEADDGVVGNNYINKSPGGVLHDISRILDTESPLPEYRNKVEDSVQFLTTYDRNDAIGIIVEEYDERSNFGLGNHTVCSESSGEIGDIFDTVDTNCDYRLSYTIEEV